MFDVVAELEANGRSLQHFARELARLLPQSGGGRRSPARHAPGGGVARRTADTGRGRAPFSEEDLTRYLQLSLDLFRDLQSSLQPRLHLEMGLLRMVQAGRLQPIEEALADLGRAAAQRRAASRRSCNAAAKLAPRLPSCARVPHPSPAAGAPRGDFAPACTPRCSKPSSRTSPMRWNIPNWPSHPTNWSFTTPKMYQLYLKQPNSKPPPNESPAGRCASPSRSASRHLRAARRPAAPQAEAEDEATARALAHPEVKRFQEVFPDAQVRTVRNLKDN